MSIYYSKSTGGFYDSMLHGDRETEVVQTDGDTGETLDRWMEPNPECKIPDDAVKISEDLYAQLFDGQGSGKVIAANDDGYPVLKDAPPPPPSPTKFAGVEFDGVMCSASSTDQNGITAVLTAYQVLGDDFKPTDFKFANGSTLTITAKNIKPFFVVWSAFRQSVI